MPSPLPLALSTISPLNVTCAFITHYILCRSRCFPSSAKKDEVLVPRIHHLYRCGTCSVVEKSQRNVIRENCTRALNSRNLVPRSILNVIQVCPVAPLEERDCSLISKNHLGMVIWPLQLSLLFLLPGHTCPSGVHILCCRCRSSGESRWLTGACETNLLLCHWISSVVSMRCCTVKVCFRSSPWILSYSPLKLVIGVLCFNHSLSFVSSVSFPRMSILNRNSKQRRRVFCLEN